MSISELFRISGAAPLSGKGVGTAKDIAGPSEFQKLLHTETAKSVASEERSITLSQHAETRIRSREISWSPELEKRVSRGMDQAQSKGSREALILAGDVAVIANVKSRTVVTAMDRNQMKDRIFTNIDSAVLV